MSKFYGKIGFVRTVEVSPGDWEPVTEEVLYSGDVMQTEFIWSNASKINPDLELNHTISIICDSFLTQNMFALQYVCYLDRRWRVKKISVQPPRMLLTLGSEYITSGKESIDDRTTSDQGAAHCYTT